MRLKSLKKFFILSVLVSFFAFSGLFAVLKFEAIELYASPADPSENTTESTPTPTESENPPSENNTESSASVSESAVTESSPSQSVNPGVSTQNSEVPEYESQASHDTEIAQRSAYYTDAPEDGNSGSARRSYVLPSRGEYLSLKGYKVDGKNSDFFIFLDASMKAPESYHRMRTDFEGGKSGYFYPPKKKIKGASYRNIPLVFAKSRKNEASRFYIWNHEKKEAYKYFPEIQLKIGRGTWTAAPISTPAPDKKLKYTKTKIQGKDSSAYYIESGDRVKLLFSMKKNEDKDFALYIYNPSTPDNEPELFKSLDQLKFSDSDKISTVITESGSLSENNETEKAENKSFFKKFDFAVMLGISVLILFIITALYVLISGRTSKNKIDDEDVADSNDGNEDEDEAKSSPDKSEVGEDKTPNEASDQNSKDNATEDTADPLEGTVNSSSNSKDEDE